MGFDSVTPIEVGSILAGKYRIDEVLGQGGMGVVVAATHVQLEQRVAIKFLLPQALANPDIVARFQREARAAVKIQSEHVARVIDVGTMDTGAPYMVMEYLDGADLAHKIASGGPVSVGEAARYLLEACEALAEAHHAGIVHRDLKPANLFLARRADRTSIVKVLDFGISKSNLGAAGAITSTQAVMGSPYYMSPEQLMSAKHVDARSDIWSLGVVLYEALVGVPPYGGDSVAEIVAQILQAAAPSVRARRADVPAQVDRIIATCLAKDPNARYADVAALARDLATLLPEGALSVDRISRILGPPEAGASVTGPVERAPMQDSRGGTVALRRSGSVSQPQAAWGATQAGPSKRSNVPFVASAVGAVLLLSGVAAIVVAVTKDKHAVQAQSGLVQSIGDPSPGATTELKADRALPPAAAPSPPPAVSSVAAPPPIATSAVATSAPARASGIRRSARPTGPFASARPLALPTPQPHRGLDMGIK